MTIYSKRTPYFYIIRHIPTGKKYAGSRYGMNCHPEELLKEDGYQTSSNVVKALIEEDGIDSFEIIQIVEVEDSLEYETLFLKENDCARSEDWLNCHNNQGMAFGTEAFKEARAKTMIERYGEENPSKVPGIVNKRTALFKERYGTSCPINSKDGREKTKKTMIERYGVEHYSQSEQFREKIRESLKTRNWKDVHDKKKKTCMEKYGVEHQRKNPECVAKTKRTCIEKYGATTALGNSEISKRAMSKRKKNMMSLYGVTNPAQREDVKEKIKAARSRDPIYTCKYCAKSIKGKGNYTRWHGDKCKAKPK